MPRRKITIYTHKKNGMKKVLSKYIRSCFCCTHYNVCYFFKSVSDINWKFNIDGTAAPGQWKDIYDAIGSCCLYYEYKSEK